MDKVYVVYCDWSYDGSSNTDIEIFSTFEKAAKFYKATLDKEKSTNGDKRYNQISEYDNNNYKEYTAYNLGRFDDDHYCLCLDEREIDGHDDE